MGLVLTEGAWMAGMLILFPFNHAMATLAVMIVLM